MGGRKRGGTTRWFRHSPQAQPRPLHPADRLANHFRVAGLVLSEDESKLLIFRNSKKVWRRNTRGDYWVLDVSNRELKKLGGDAAPSKPTASRGNWSDSGTWDGSL